MGKWQDPTVIFLWIIITIFLLVILILFITFLVKINFRKNLEKRELIFNERIKTEQKLKEAIITTQENERKLIASELHDQISNKLNLVVLKLNSIDENTCKTQVGEIREDLKKLIKKNRDITHYLYPVEIENLGLILSIKELCYNSNDFNINLFTQTEDLTFPSKIAEHQIYRVIQEFITNSIKHSKGNMINIHVRKLKDKIFFLISDNGVGIDLEKITKGLGVNNTETRLSAINAKYKYNSTLNKGTRLIIAL